MDAGLNFVSSWTLLTGSRGGSGIPILVLLFVGGGDVEDVEDG